MSTTAPLVRPARWWTLLGASVLLAALLPVAEPPAVPAARDDGFITAQTAGILTIEAGECFSNPFHSRSAGGTIVIYTPCDQPVDNQSYGFLRAPDGPWDRPTLADFAWAGCGEGFRRHWPEGTESGLDFYPVLPTAETWADGDRDVMCVVYRPAGRLAGSALPRAVG